MKRYCERWRAWICSRILVWFAVKGFRNKERGICRRFWLWCNMWFDSSTCTSRRTKLHIAAWMDSGSRKLLPQKMRFQSSRVRSSKLANCMKVSRMSQRKPSHFHKIKSWVKCVVWIIYLYFKKTQTTHHWTNGIWTSCHTHTILT